jgi:(p)ppGpp synthase/HD superfamily hydrolase
MNNTIKWCFEQHKKTNHFYDDYLPYEFHLRMALNVYEDFKHLLDDVDDYFMGNYVPDMRKGETIVTLREACYYATAGHDLIEDCRLSYNDVKSKLGSEAAEIIYAVTNEKGKTRDERANDKYYEGIRNTKGAVFVKLCDRIANVQYSKMTKSRMFQMYRNELHMFLVKLGYSDGEIDNYKPMIDYLNKLFKD